MKLTLNIHGSIATFYRAFWNTTDLPGNLCTYFWKLVFAILLTPLCWPALLVNWKFNPINYDSSQSRYRGLSDRIDTFWGAIINACILLIGLVITMSIYSEKIAMNMARWKLYVNGIIGCCILLLLIVAIVYLIKYISAIAEKQRPQYKGETNEEYISRHEREALEYALKEAAKQKSFWYLMKKSFIAWKEKNCPIITWQDNKIKPAA